LIIVKFLFLFLDYFTNGKYPLLNELELTIYYLKNDKETDVNMYFRDSSTTQAPSEAITTNLTSLDISGASMDEDSKMHLPSYNQLFTNVAVCVESEDVEKQLPCLKSKELCQDSSTMNVELTIATNSRTKNSEMVLNFANNNSANKDDDDDDDDDDDLNTQNSNSSLNGSKTKQTQIKIVNLENEDLDDEMDEIIDTIPVDMRIVDTQQPEVQSNQEGSLRIESVIATVSDSTIEEAASGKKSPINSNDSINKSQIESQAKPMH
jgi:hypothetical protein